jgi:hypothetical protein
MTKTGCLVAVATIALFPMWTLAAPAPADHEAHHPAGTAEQAPQAPNAAEGASGMMGGMPMMGRMQMMGGGGPGMDMIDRVEGRIAFLRAEIKISDAQTGVWNEFAVALRTNAQNLAAARKGMMPQPGADQPEGQTLSQRLDAEERWGRGWTARARSRPHSENSTRRSLSSRRQRRTSCSLHTWG